MEIHKIACVGSGLIGSDWATLFVSKGYAVTLQDINMDILDNAVAVIKTNLEFMAEHHLARFDDIDTLLHKITLTTSIEDAVAKADYIQESVFDDLDLKHQVFKTIDAAAPDHAIIASSASGLLMTDIQKSAARPGRCVMVHPILPAHLIPLVEIGGGPDTLPQTLDSADRFMKRLGKTTVVLKKEVPGYIVNRLQAAVLREAMDLVDRGVATAEDVDLAFCKGCGIRDPFIGPFLRAHLAGDNIERFFQNYSRSYQYRYETMKTWTAFPPSAVDTVVKEVKKMPMVVNTSIDDLKAWRNDKLVQMLKIT